MTYNKDPPMTCVCFGIIQYVSITRVYLMQDLTSHQIGESSNMICEIIYRRNGMDAFQCGPTKDQSTYSI